MSRCTCVLAVTGVVFAFAHARCGCSWRSSLGGALSTEVVESGPFTSLEQAMLAAELRAPASSLAGSASTTRSPPPPGSLGALAAGRDRSACIGVVERAQPTSAGSSYWFRLRSPALLIAATAERRRRTDGAQSPSRSTSRPRATSRPIVLRLAGAVRLDSFAGGFTVQAFVAFWLAQRFDASVGVLGVTFFAVGVLQTAVVPRRPDGSRTGSGCCRTMVFTHLPSNLVLDRHRLLAHPARRHRVAPAAHVALSQMDVPARQAYVMALVEPAERTAAASVTNTARYLTRPAGPVLAGAAQSVAARGSRS